MEHITGTVDRIVYHNADTHFTVARLRPDRAERHPRLELATIVGALPGVQVGETLRLEGDWSTHLQHGREFRIARFEPQLPNSVEGIRRYLGSGLIKGIGPVMAGRIVDRFGDGALQVIEETPEQLLEVGGISRKRIELIAQAWTAQREIKALMVFLRTHEVSLALASRIFQAYGAEALGIVRTDPYRMVKDVHGIGFRTADDLAMKLGLPAQSVSRFAAGLKHVLSQATDDGHVFLPRPILLRQGAELLRCAPEALDLALARMLADHEAIADGEDIYLTPLFLAERHAARRLALLRGPGSSLFAQGGMDQWLAADEAGLSSAQRDAIALALRERLAVLTGGPGVGKSTTVRGLVAVLAKVGIRFCLAAPTGRAARRLAEATGQPSHTIHRLLRYSQSLGGFTVNEESPLPFDFVVVDEASMLDIALFHSLLKAIRPGTHLLLVGDADQLPSVGPGNVLRDLIASEVAPVARLTELFRQARESRIVLAAHRINAGELPVLANERVGDLFFLREDDPKRALETICGLVAERLPARYGFSPRGQIQVISPMHRGPLGVAHLNERLQERINPEHESKTELRVGGRVFRAGDRVMQVRNDYERDVFNGDMGIVERVEPEGGALLVRFGPGAESPVPLTPLETEDVVRYDAGNLDELTHAWAVSVHKSQGSEFACVVLVLSTQHQLMLRRNLLYTAITRAKRLCVIVGSPAALATAVRTDHAEGRYSALARRLRDEVG